MTATPKKLSSSLHNLSLHSAPPRASASVKKSQATLPIADSWEDEAEDSGEDIDRLSSPQQSTDHPSAPPPTPISPTPLNSQTTESFFRPFVYGEDGSAENRWGERERRDARPEKTDAVAKRMIAGALGVKATKKTEEQKAYDRAIREKEIKRRNREKEDASKAEEEADRAKAAVWED